MISFTVCKRKCGYRLHFVGCNSSSLISLKVPSRMNYPRGQFIAAFNY